MLHRRTLPPILTDSDGRRAPRGGLGHDAQDGQVGSGRLRAGRGGPPAGEGG